MLARAFPDSSQSIAFYHFCNFRGRVSSKTYEQSRKSHIEKVREAALDPVRCRKISEALKGKPKSEEHKKKLRGHPVSQKTRDSVRQASLGRKWSESQREKFILARTGSKRKPHTQESRKLISQSKLDNHLKWCNNGKEERCAPAENLPAGWVLGRLKEGPTEGRKHYNNGKESKLFVSPPDSTWVLGRLKTLKKE